MDAEQLREYGHKMVDFIADYYKNIENFPVLSQVQVFIYFLQITRIVKELRAHLFKMILVELTNFGNPNTKHKYIVQCRNTNNPMFVVS